MRVSLDRLDLLSLYLLFSSPHPPISRKLSNSHSSSPFSRYPSPLLPIFPGSTPPLLPVYAECYILHSGGQADPPAASLWNELMAPKGNAGAMLLSPSMCKQMAEDGWLGQFQTKISRDWDITNVHINKNNMEGVKATIDYYYNKYKKPLWVTEVS